MAFTNVYEDAKRAEAYSQLEFPGTYYLAYRDLPEIIGLHVRGRRALDFGCGAGRSTRFLKERGFNTMGVDISSEMIARARERDPEGDYRLLGKEGLAALPPRAYDLVLSVFTFDNIPTRETKVALFTELGHRLDRNGKIVNLVSSPEIYTHEWASFSTRDFPENGKAKSGDRVRIIMTDVPDRRPVEDVFWTETSYHEVFQMAGLEAVARYEPLGREDEPYPWINETRISPWRIDVLAARA